MSTNSKKIRYWQLPATLAIVGLFISTYCYYAGPWPAKYRSFERLLRDSRSVSNSFFDQVKVVKYLGEQGRESSNRDRAYRALSDLYQRSETSFTGRELEVLKTLIADAFGKVGKKEAIELLETRIYSEDSRYATKDLHRSKTEKVIALLEKM